MRSPRSRLLTRNNFWVVRDSGTIAEVGAAFRRIWLPDVVQPYSPRVSPNAPLKNSALLNFRQGISLISTAVLISRGLDSSGLSLGLVPWPGLLHRNGGNESKEKARKLRVFGPDHSCQAKFPGPKAERRSDQTRY